MATLQPNAPLAINYPHRASLEEQYEFELEAREKLGQQIGESIVQELSSTSPEDVVYYAFRGLRKHTAFDYNLNYHYSTLSTTVVEVRQTNFVGTVLYVPTTEGEDTSYLVQEIVNLRKDCAHLEGLNAKIKKEHDAIIDWAQENIYHLTEELREERDSWYGKTARLHKKWASELRLILRYPIAYMRDEVQPQEIPF